MSNALDAVLAQYEKNSQGSSDSNRMSQEERMKKYFACILPQGQSQGQRRVRILPTKDGSSPFVEVYYHELQVGGKWQKFYDPGKNDNERSPLNEVHEELMATGKESDKELARQYKSRKFYIAKVVDRDASIQTIMHDDPSILQEDAEVMKSWLADELTWQDVYSKKPVEYLEAIARGEEPRWDSETGKYVYGDEAIMSMGGGKSSGVADPQAGADPDEDLPF
jgi:hypothetical protein